jgi:hypothetical protein
MTAGSAWYEVERARFLSEEVDTVVGHLASAAGKQGLHIEPEQHQEWSASVGLLKEHLDEKARMIALLKETLSSPELSTYEHIILEYDFRRRGLRVDCVLLGKGIIVVIEFKRSQFTAADRSQVSDYCINFIEFHEETKRVCGNEQCIVVPILALTEGVLEKKALPPGSFHNPPWSAVLREPLLCDRDSLKNVLLGALSLRRAQTSISPDCWLQARFSPSSTIIDAAISLYGEHDVSSINAHAAPAELISRCTEGVAKFILESRRDKKSRIIFVSGAPGAGKTLVGLKLAFDRRFRADTVFVTGNAPLVEVLEESLKRSYRSKRSGIVASGYAQEQAIQVIRMSTFKIMKAHAFLGKRGSETGSADGRIVVFDEAQRTYKKGRLVARERLKDDEAALILDSLTNSYGPGAVVVALIGHNQVINDGEMGIGAWFKAATKRGWRVAISDQTLDLLDQPDRTAWTQDRLRDVLPLGHLPHSMRFYRNHAIEQWADKVLTESPAEAKAIAEQLGKSGDSIWLTRDLAIAKGWVRARRVGDETAGLVASAQARRLAAEGLFVELKPNIAPWILAPAGDIRSSNMLETVQNQYQIQGLEIDYSVVCWDADLRRSGNRWASFQISGADWQNDSSLEIAKNGYRVVLTRARKGMVIFVPKGDLAKEDSTRDPDFYESIAEYLLSCGAVYIA